MNVNTDFRDLLRGLNKTHSKYLVIGAYAVVHYTFPRDTKDLDVWISTDSENIENVWQALVEFGAPMDQITEMI